MSVYNLPVESGNEARVRKILATDCAVVKCWKVSAIGKMLGDEMEHVRRQREDIVSCHFRGTKVSVYDPWLLLYGRSRRPNSI